MNRHSAPENDPTGVAPPLFEGVGLVIFDFDGVIADSEVISLATLRQSLAVFGIDLPAQTVRDMFLGTSLATISAYVAAHAPGGGAAGFADTWQRALFERFRAELAPVPLVGLLLDRLSAAGLAYCIASSSTHERLGVALAAMRMAARFDHVFSAEQVARGKPAPDLFLHAAAVVGVAPDRCLVIEDSPFGVRAAKAAGMRCAGFVGGAHLEGIAERHAAALRAAGAEEILVSFEPLLR